MGALRFKAGDHVIVKSKSVGESYDAWLRKSSTRRIKEQRPYFIVEEIRNPYEMRYVVDSNYFHDKDLEFFTESEEKLLEMLIAGSISDQVYKTMKRKDV